MSSRLTPHSVKRWQLQGTDYAPPRDQVRAPGTLFSSWTPLTDKTHNLQLFEKRVGLVLHWFDLWTDGQRKHVLQALLSRSNRTQLKFCRDLLIERVPVTRADFTAVLPRFLSLYVLSSLSPRDLCSAAQVCWTWRILAEQDCLWVSRCVPKGWFLPYTPVPKEYGAWKSHYVTCFRSMHFPTPREAERLYGTLNQRGGGATDQEEREERARERRVRHLLRQRVQHDKSEALRTRPPWGSSVPPVHPTRSPSVLCPEPLLRLSVDEGHRNMSRSRSVALSSDPHSGARPLLLLSDALPAYEMALGGVKAEVLSLLFDHRLSLTALLARVDEALCGRRALRLGVLAPGGTDSLHLLQRSEITEETVLAPECRDFWEKMCARVVPKEEGGGIDIFCPIAAAAAGLSLMQKLTSLTGLEVCAPMGLSTGSFQNILGEWCDSSLSACTSGVSPQQTPPSPPLQYLHSGALQAWCTQGLWLEESLRELRVTAGRQLQSLSAQSRGRALGQYFQENICTQTLHLSRTLNPALTAALRATANQEEAEQLNFLAGFLTKLVGEQTKESDEEEETVEEPHSTVQALAHLSVVECDWRRAVVRELQQSEALYVSRLTAVQKVYQEPLTAALRSHSAIISAGDISLILRPVVLILQLNEALQTDLDSRLRQWSAQQCVGDVFVQFCFKLKVYTNYFNNYPTALHVVDKCRENRPLFRAFLSRVDRTLATHMLSLPELLLCPLWRIEEYCTLLQALSLHTVPGHADHRPLASALSTLRSYTHFLHQLKRQSQRDRELEETQQMIQGCPNLAEGTRQLLSSHVCALYQSPDDTLPDCFRALEQVADVGLFLFTDALVLTRLDLRHVPFSVSQRRSYSFMASVALSSLSVREVNHSRYVSHAFVLDGPRRSWTCASLSAADRRVFLCALRDTMDAVATH